MLRAAYSLLDAGEPDAASALFRVMSEYLIVGGWLTDVGKAGMEGWALDDFAIAGPPSERSSKTHADKHAEFPGSCVHHRREPSGG